MWRYDFDWHSPTRLVDSPTKCDSPGDRFIPNRSLMDLDHAKSLMTCKNGVLPDKSNFSVEYRRKVEEQLNLDSEGRPFRMLVFRGSPASSKKSLRHIDELSQQDEPETWKNNKEIRILPKSADRVLDAPLLMNNYYLTLIDWGRNNVLAAALGSAVYLWNANDDKVQGLMQADENTADYPTSVAWSDNAKTVAVGLYSSKLQLWDAEKFQLVRCLQGHDMRIGCLAWKGQSLTSGSQDKFIINHDVRARNSLISRIRAHTDEVCGLKWSGGGSQLASGGNDNILYLWEASSMSSSKPLHRLSDHTAAIRALAWCPHQQNVLASGGGTDDQCIKIWNSQSGKCLRSVDSRSQVCGLEWNRHRKELLSGHGYSENRLCLWKYPSMTKVGDLLGHTDRIINLSQSPDGSTVVSAGADETLRLWKVFEPPKVTTKDDLESLLSLKRFQIR